MRSKRGFWRVFLSFVYLLYKLAISLFEKLAARYFFIAPLPYAFGNLNEEIKMGILASASVNKPIIYLLPPGGIFAKIFDFKQCNSSIYEACRELSYNSAGKMNYYLIYAVYLFIFIIFRGTFIVLNNIKTFDSGLAQELTTEISYYLSFPRMGTRNAWQKLVNSDMSKELIRKAQLELNEFSNLLNKKCNDNLYKGRGVNFKLPNSPFIVCHVRTSYYYNDKERRNRNANIEYYLEGMMKVINETDYSIIIIGDPNGLGTSIHPNVINVPELGLDEQTQRAFETLAVMNCSLFVGTQSGPWDLALLIGIDTILLNSIDISTSECTLWSEHILITKPVDKDLYSSFFKNYNCDLNDQKNSFKIFNYSSNRKTTTSVFESISYTLSKYSVTPKESIYSYFYEERSKMMESIKECLMNQRFFERINSDKIRDIYEKIDI